MTERDIPDNWSQDQAGEPIGVQPNYIPNNGLSRTGYGPRGSMSPALGVYKRKKIFNSSGLIDLSVEAKRGHLGSFQN